MTLVTYGTMCPVAEILNANHIYSSLFEKIEVTHRMNIFSPQAQFFSTGKNMPQELIFEQSLLTLARASVTERQTTFSHRLSISNLEQGAEKQRICKITLICQV